MYEPEGTNIHVLELLGEPFQYGGQESYIMANLQNMDLSGLVIDLLTPYSVDNLAYEKMIEEKGGNVYSLGLPFNPGHSRQGIYEPLKAFFENKHYDIVHIHSGSTSVFPLAARAARESGVKHIIVHSHASGKHFGMKNRILRRLASISLKRNVDLYCACSRDAGESKFLPDASHGIHVLKNGIAIGAYKYTPEKRQRVRDALGVTDDAFIVGNVGRLSDEKNHAFLLDVFDEVRKAIPNSELWIVGDGPLRDSIKKKIALTSLEGRVRLLGARDDVPDILSAFDVFVFPSKWEGLGISLLEAQAAGLPCVISDVIPKEAVACPSLVCSNSLDAQVPSWASLIISFEGTRDPSAWKAVKEAGYDVKDSAERLRQIYIQLASR